VWWDTIDEVVTVDDRTAYQTVLELTRLEGIFVGSSGGAAAAAARQIAQRVQDDPEALVVTLFPDSGDRYLSKLNRDWMTEKGVA
jgi:cysteine synthase